MLLSPGRISGRETVLPLDRISGKETVRHQDRTRGLETVQHQDRIKDRETGPHPVRINEPATGPQDRISALETDRPDRVTGHSVRVTDPLAPDQATGPRDREIVLLEADLEIVRQEDDRVRDQLVENRQQSL